MKESGEQDLAKVGQQDLRLGALCSDRGARGLNRSRDLLPELLAGKGEGLHDRKEGREGTKLRAKLSLCGQDTPGKVIDEVAQVHEEDIRGVALLEARVDRHVEVITEEWGDHGEALSLKLEEPLNVLL